MLQVGMETTEARFDEAALTRIGNALTEDSKRAMQLKPAKSFCFNRMSECMFEPNNWRRYKVRVYVTLSLWISASGQGIMGDYECYGCP